MRRSRRTPRLCGIPLGGVDRKGGAGGVRVVVGRSWREGWVKVGWRVSRRDPADRALMWSYMPPHFPLPRHLYSEEMDIRCRARDAERKSRERLR